MLTVFEREDGTKLTVTSQKSRGEPGSLSITDCVEITRIRDAAGADVEITDNDELAAIQHDAEEAFA